MKHVLLFFLLLLLGFLITIAYKKYSVVQQTTRLQIPLPKGPAFSLDTPPTQSMQGNILTMSGNIEWQSRSATEPAAFTTRKNIIQGEQFWTNKNSELTILFPSAVEIIMSDNSHINIIQSLPTNVVLGQNTGSIRYKKLSPTTPIGIRAKNMLIQQQSGDIEVNFDDNDPLIVINVFKGSAVIAFNNSETVSTVVSVDEKKTYTYDYEKREGEMTTTD